jgi:hypothetical protein
VNNVVDNDTKVWETHFNFQNSDSQKFKNVGSVAVWKRGSPQRCTEFYTEFHEVDPNKTSIKRCVKLPATLW